jgi:enoyl-[acyl-carrier-protein] reductase (NADH)
MENIKLPLALVAAMAAQLAGGVWWTAQQAATIADLEETVSQLGSRMAIEDNVNMKRDVERNADDIDDLWDDVGGLSMSIMEINELKQRISTIEVELKYIGRDHEGMLDMKGEEK